MSNLSNFIRTKLKFNPFTGKPDMVGSNAESGYVTQEELTQAVEPFKAQTNANFQNLNRSLTLMQNALSSKQEGLEASSAYYGKPILSGNVIRSLGASDPQNLMQVVEFGHSLQIQLSDQVATKDFVNSGLNSFNSAMQSMAQALGSNISQAYEIANQAKSLANSIQTPRCHWESYPVLASESGDEFSQLASGIQNNQGVIFWMSLTTNITFSECIIYAVSYPSEYQIQVGIYDENNNLICKTGKHTVTKYGTVRFPFVNENGVPISTGLSSKALFKIAIWSSKNNFRILAGQDCSSAFESIRKLMSSILTVNPNGLTDVAEVIPNSHVNRFPYIKLVG